MTKLNKTKNANVAIETNVTNDATTTNDVALTCAHVARIVAHELKMNLCAKRVRAYLRKNNELYAIFRNKTFTRESSLYAHAHDVITKYAQSKRAITQ